MIRTSEVNAESNIETTVKCVACGHICKEVYIVKDSSIVDVKEYGDKFAKTSEKVVLVDSDNKEAETVYKCPSCGILQTEVVKQ